MQPFTTLTAPALPLTRANIDTDAIIPKQFLKTIKRTGLGKNLFYDWRYLAPPAAPYAPDPSFELNQPRYGGARLLITGPNFGCGSSREHAPWALLDAGFCCIIAPSFADIFYNNCFKNGILPLVLTAQEVQDLARDCREQEGYTLSVDLAAQTVTTPTGHTLHFEIDPFRKDCLRKGLDDIGLTLHHEAEITAFEAGLRTQAPWLMPRHP